ncbi:MAG: bifunctional biotin--[acetyl-CoA-carboxylase] ligase/biotin operon repressor BirA [Legionellales bacterium]|nr:bifunctional biotin--[acetyl-CoA-carboxylase] ligase/biotin operon repressor BirA [Legionellales bacterium]
MKQLQRILAILADGNFHSGEEIGQRLQMSRSAIWKTLKACEDEMGFELHTVRGRGYRIPGGLDLLDAEHIRRHLNPTVYKLIPRLDIFEAIDSTNRYLLNYDHAENGHVCLAEQQFAGRGRQGRSWASPYATNIYLSLLWLVNDGPGRLSGLSLVTGIAVIKALQRYGIPGLKLKWPNDIVYQGAKLGGILVEIAGDLAGRCRVIIGIGINTAMPAAVGKKIDQPWIDTTTILNKMPQRNVLTALLLEELFTILPQFCEWGLSAYIPEWQKLDLTYGKEIIVQTPAKTLQGKGQGIDQHGNLLLQTPETLHTLFSGEVSVRPIYETSH